MRNLQAHRGFTLIEALIYLALFAIFIGGAVVSAYNLFEAATHGSTIVMMQEEMDFLMAKIDWTLDGAQAVTAPATGAAGQALTVVKWDATAGNPIVVALNGTNLTLSHAGNTPAILNNTNVFITNLTFTHGASSGDGINPESVVVALTISARTPYGTVLTRSATSTVYVRH